MLSFVLVVVFVLLVVVYVYWKSKVDFIRRITRSVVKGILIIVVMLSVVVSLSLVLTDVAFVCHVRYIDFLINLYNAIYLSILLGYLASKVITRPRIAYFSVRYAIPSFLVIIQLVLGGMAHFTRVEEKKEKISIHVCYDERKKPIVTISYCYDLALMVVCIVLMLSKLYRSRRYYKRSGKFELFSVALLSISMTVIYWISLSFVLLPKDGTDCRRHADCLVVLAMFPAMISMLGFIFSIIKPVHKRLKRCHLWIGQARATLLMHVYDLWFRLVCGMASF